LVYQIDQWDEKAEEYLTKYNSKDKNVVKLSSELDLLRNKLVTTTGDNYVGSAELQLKEKLNDIYGNIASYYGAPSSTQMESVASLKKDFEAARNTFDKINSTLIKSFDTEMKKNKSVAPILILSFDEFLKLD
jgi:hypothetical protein